MPYTTTSLLRLLQPALVLALFAANLSGCAVLRRLQALHAPSASTAAAAPAEPFEKKVRAAAVQYPIEGGKTLDEILKKMEGLITEAKLADADLIVFPELVSFDAWPAVSRAGEPAAIRTIATAITPVLFEQAKRWSSTYGSAILIGSSPRLVGDRIRNSALLAFPDGRTVIQDKVHLTPWEREHGWQAGNQINVFKSPWGLSAILISYDVEFPDVSQALVKARPHVLLVPSMSKTESGLQRVRWAAQARAVEHHAYVVLSSAVGAPASDWKLIGQSALISPREPGFDEPHEMEKNRPGVVLSDLKTTLLRASRATTRFYPARDQAMRQAGSPAVRAL